MTAFSREWRNIVFPVELMIVHWNLLTLDSSHMKAKTKQTLPEARALYSHRLMTLPNTDESWSMVEQFQRSNLNCSWHCSTPSFAPFPMLVITSGLSRHSWSWVPTSPTMLLHITLAPRANTLDMYLSKKEREKERIYYIQSIGMKNRLRFNTYIQWLSETMKRLKITTAKKSSFTCSSSMSLGWRVGDECSLDKLGARYE